MTFFYWKHKAKLELTRKKMYTANALVLWRHPVLSTNCINPSWSFRLPIGNPKKCYPWSFFKPSCTIYHTTTHWHCSWTKDLTDPLLNLLPNRAPKAFFLPTTNHNNDTWLSWWRQREYRYILRRGEGSLLTNILCRNCVDKNETIVRKILEVRESFASSRVHWSQEKYWRRNLQQQTSAVRSVWWYTSTASALHNEFLQWRSILNCFSVDEKCGDSCQESRADSKYQLTLKRPVTVVLTASHVSLSIVWQVGPQGISRGPLIG